MFWNKISYENDGYGELLYILVTIYAVCKNMTLPRVRYVAFIFRLVAYVRLTKSIKMSPELYVVDIYYH